MASHGRATTEFLCKSSVPDEWRPECLTRMFSENQFFFLAVQPIG